MTHPLKAHIEKITGPLSTEEFDYILSHFRPIKRKKHQFIVQEGDAAQYEHWVISGCLRAYLVDNSGKEHILQFAMEDWWITDYNAYFNRTAATIFIDCIEDSELVGISLENREKLCSEMHKMEHFWRVKANFGYVALQKRILSLLQNSAQERYEQLLEQYPKLFQKVPKKMIAAFLGVSRETLSRLK